MQEEDKHEEETGKGRSGLGNLVRGIMLSGFFTASMISLGVGSYKGLDRINYHMHHTSVEGLGEASYEDVVGDKSSDQFFQLEDGRKAYLRIDDKPVAYYFIGKEQQEDYDRRMTLVAGLAYTLLGATLGFYAGSTIKSLRILKRKTRVETTLNKSQN